MRTIIYMSLLLLLFSCDFDISGISDSEAELPDITNTGEDTFGCKINGSVFIPKFSSSISNQALFAYGQFKENGYFEISAKNQNWKKNGCTGSGSWVELNFYLDSNKNIKDKANLDFLECSKKSEGTFNDPYEIYSGNIIKNSDASSNSFEILNYDTSSTHYIILSVTFRGNVYAPNSDLKKITKGRFDVKFSK